MTDYPVLTMETAPASARPVLAEVQGAFGLVPNIAMAMAYSPELLTAFWGLFRQVHSGTFSEAEIQTLLLTNAVTNRAIWPVAFHSMLALKEGLAPEDVQAIRAGGLPRNNRLAALAAFARALIETRGQPAPSVLADLRAAGFTQGQSLEILAVTAASTITNYTASLTKPPLEAFLQDHVWEA